MGKLNIYKLTQNTNRDWDTYDSAVVVAKTPEDAKRIYPSGGSIDEYDCSGAWAKPDQVTAELVGTTTTLPAGTVICASFNAG